MSCQMINQVGILSDKPNRLCKFQKHGQNRPSTGKLKSCSERIMKLALPSMHIVVSVLREHFKKLSREQIGRLEKLLQQIQEFHQKNNPEELMKTFNDFGPSEKEKILEIIENVENKTDFEGAQLNKTKLIPIKSASDTFLISLDKKLNFLYLIDDKKFDCQSSEDFLNSQSDISSFNIFKLASSLQKTQNSFVLLDKKQTNLQCEKEVIENHLNKASKQNNKKSTVTIYTQYSDQSVTTYNTASSRSQLLHSLKEEGYEEDTKILFIKNLTQKRTYPKQKSFLQTWKADVEHVRGDFARIRQHIHYRRNEQLVPVYYRQRLVRIMHNIYYILTYEIVEALTKCLNQVWNIDNYIYCIYLPFKSYSKLKPLLSSILHEVKVITENPKHFDLTTYINNVNRFCLSVVTHLIPLVILRPITTVMECFCSLMFSYDDDYLLELNSKNLKALKAKSRRRRKYRYSVQVQNISSILQ